MKKFVWWFKKVITKLLGKKIIEGNTRDGIIKDQLWKIIENIGETQVIVKRYDTVFYVSDMSKLGPARLKLVSIVLFRENVVGTEIKDFLKRALKGIEELDRITFSAKIKKFQNNIIADMRFSVKYELDPESYSSYGIQIFSVQ